MQCPCVPVPPRSGRTSAGAINALALVIACLYSTFESQAALGHLDPVLSCRMDGTCARHHSLRMLCEHLLCMQMATVLFYLTDVEEGGETIFPLEGRDGLQRLSHIDYRKCDMGLKVMSHLSHLAARHGLDILRSMHEGLSGDTPCCSVRVQFERPHQRPISFLSDAFRCSTNGFTHT